MARASRPSEMSFCATNRTSGTRARTHKFIMSASLKSDRDTALQRNDAMCQKWRLATAAKTVLLIVGAIERAGRRCQLYLVQEARYAVQERGDKE